MRLNSKQIAKMIEIEIQEFMKDKISQIWVDYKFNLPTWNHKEITLQPEDIEIFQKDKIDLKFLIPSILRILVGTLDIELSKVTRFNERQICIDYNQNCPDIREHKYNIHFIFDHFGISSGDPSDKVLRSYGVSTIDSELEYFTFYPITCTLGQLIPHDTIEEMIAKNEEIFRNINNLIDKALLDACDQYRILIKELNQNNCLIERFNIYTEFGNETKYYLQHNITK